METVSPSKNQSLLNLLESNFPKLNGEQGENRCKRRPCQIPASNDLEAVYCWLNEYQEKEATFRSYRKEAERLILWSVISQKKALSSLNRLDFDAYFSFVKNPAPKEMWCAAKGSRKRKRHEPAWRPFTGPLGPAAQMNAIAVLDSLFKYLVAASYLDFNPLSLMRRKKSQLYRKQALALKLHERVLEDEEWQLILKTLKELPENDESERSCKARLRFLVSILFLLGLRINELETHTWASFQKVRGHWWFFVTGKGDKPGKIPVNDELLAEIQRFRTALRLSPLPGKDDNSPLIPSWHQNKPLSARQMSYLLKTLSKKAVESCELDEDRKEKLKKFSPHWIRHLSASRQDEAGVSFKHIKANHRHESDETTRRYIHALDDDRHIDMRKLKLFT